MEYNKVDFSSIGDKIHNARKARAINQDEFIEILKRDYGVKLGRNTLSYLENGVRNNYGIELFFAICDFFGWDMGYLFDEYTENTKANHIICEQTGLDESAVKIITSWKKSDDRRQIYPDILSKIITSENSDDLFGNIGECITYSALEKKALVNGNPDFAVELIDLEMARLWNTSRIFSNIVEALSLQERQKGDK